jgi:hypothetical protein
MLQLYPVPQVSMQRKRTAISASVWNHLDLAPSHYLCLQLIDRFGAEQSGQFTLMNAGVTTRGPKFSPHRCLLSLVSTHELLRESTQLLAAQCVVHLPTNPRCPHKMGKLKIGEKGNKSDPSNSSN